MKYIFFGTPRFAEIVLDRLIAAGMPPVALVCNPDRPAGRKKIITPPPTKQLVAAHGAAIPLLQPEKLDEYFMETLRGFDADIFVVAAYGKILPGAVLGIPRLGVVGVHPSLLPKYRGASPIQSVILNGETETGVTLYWMDEKMDRGPIIASARVPMDSLRIQYPELEEQLAALGGDILLRTMPDIAAGKAARNMQDEAAATYTKKFTTEDAFVDESKEAPEAILRKINAFTPEPGAWTVRNGARMKLLKAELRAGKLSLLTVQREGGAAYSLSSFLISSFISSSRCSTAFSNNSFFFFKVGRPEVNLFPFAHGHIHVFFDLLEITAEFIPQSGQLPARMPSPCGCPVNEPICSEDAEQDDEHEEPSPYGKECCCAAGAPLFRCRMFHVGGHAAPTLKVNDASRKFPA